MVWNDKLTDKLTDRQTCNILLKAMDIVGWMAPTKAENKIPITTKYHSGLLSAINCQNRKFWG